MHRLFILVFSTTALVLAMLPISHAVAAGQSFFFTYGGVDNEHHTMAYATGMGGVRAYVSITSSPSQYSINGWDIYAVYVADTGVFSYGYTYDMGGDEYATASIVYMNNTYIVGYIARGNGSNRDAFMMALSPDLTPLWAVVVKDYGNETLSDIDVDTRGNLIAVGTVSSANVSDPLIINVSSNGVVNWGYRIRSPYLVEARGVAVIPYNTTIALVGVRRDLWPDASAYVSVIRGGGAVTVEWDATLWFNSTEIVLNDVEYCPRNKYFYATGHYLFHTNGVGPDAILYPFSPGGPNVAFYRFATPGMPDDGKRLDYSATHGLWITGTINGLGMGGDEQFIVNASETRSGLSYVYRTLGTRGDDEGVWISAADPGGVVVAGDTNGVPVSGGYEAYSTYINESSLSGIVFPPINKTLMVQNVTYAVEQVSTLSHEDEPVPISITQLGVSYEAISPGWDLEPIPETWMILILPTAATAAALYIWKHWRRGPG